MFSKNGYSWIAVFLAAFVLRLGVAIWLPNEVVWPDGLRYERIAHNLIDGVGFGSLMENRQSVPTQPLVIAAVYATFGENYTVLRSVFAVLGALSCVLGGMLAKRLFGFLTGVVTGVLLAVYPFLVYLSALFEYPQTLFILVMAVFFLCYYRFAETKSKTTLFAATVALGLGILTVPTTLIFAAVFGFFLLTRDIRETAARLSVCALAAVLTVGVWAARNYVAYDTPILVNAAGGGAFYVGNNDTYWRYGKAGVVPACAPGYESSVYCREVTELTARLDRQGLSDVEYVLEEERASWDLGLQFVKEDPRRFLMLTGRKFLEFWNPIPDAVHADEAQGGRWRDVVAIASYVPLLLMAAAGVFATRAQWRQLLPIYVYIAAFIAPYVVFFPTTRYRLPIDFLLVMFAAVATIRLYVAVAGVRSRVNA